MLAPLLAAGLMMGVAACSQPTQLVVLLDQADGSPSAVEVKTKAGTQVLDKPGQATRFGADVAPTAPFELGEAEVKRIFAAAIAAQPEPPVTFVLYFVLGKTDLTAQSKALVPKILEVVAKRAAPEIAVIGHTDRIGTDAFNTALGLDRAERVRDIILAAGADPSAISIASHGENNPLIPTADGVDEPKNRRVEVTVR